MTEPMTDAELEAIRTMPFTTSLNVGCGVYATDEERHLYRLAAENHNAKLALVAEIKRLRAELADVPDCEDCPGNKEAHADTLRALHMEQQSHTDTRGELHELRTRATRELLHALRLAVVTIRAAWVEAERIGADEGIEVLEELVLATAQELPDLDQYDGAQAVFDAEYGATDRTTDAKKLRARLATKETS